MSARDEQVGGEHYKLPIQPIDYIYANGLEWCEANVLKYITRWRNKGGARDLEKARHYIDLLIERESAAHRCTHNAGIVFGPDQSTCLKCGKVVAV